MAPILAPLTECVGEGLTLEGLDSDGCADEPPPIEEQSALVTDDWEPLLERFTDSLLGPSSVRKKIANFPMTFYHHQGNNLKKHFKKNKKRRNNSKYLPSPNFAFILLRSVDKRSEEGCLTWVFSLGPSSKVALSVKIPPVIELLLLFIIITDKKLTTNTQEYQPKHNEMFEERRTRSVT